MMTREEAINIVRNIYQTDAEKEALGTLIPELRESESESERTRKCLSCLTSLDQSLDVIEDMGLTRQQLLDWLEKQKENPKSADSIPSDCVSDAKCENRWHKVQDSLPDNGRLVLAQDCLGNTLLARYDGEGNWEVSVYDNEDYYCRNTITKWCEIPSEKQKEQKPAVSREEILYQLLQNSSITMSDYLYLTNKQKPAEWSEEDQLMRSACIAFIKDEKFKGYERTYECIDWIKSLHPSWKPSEEQMGALKEALETYKGFEEYDAMKSLYNELKKLM